MVMRVSTFNQTSSVLQMAMTTQAKLAQVQQQQASGLISTEYGDLGSDAGTVLDLSVSIARSDALISSAERIATRSEMSASILGQISDLLTNTRTLVNATSTDIDIASLQSNAQNNLEDLASLVNTQYEGRYLFAGSLTETSPVDLTAYAATSLTTVNTDYYQGDDYIQTARVGEERSIDYGITGNDDAIEQAMRALSYLANASPLETSELADVSELLISAQDAIIAAQSASGTATNRLETFIENETSFKTEAESLATDLTSVDVAVATVEATTYKTQLEASYSALNVMINLSLVDYLNL
ncbi:flagellin [Cohaesibacter celericrescens]|uniref:Flagellar biosynthesis protein FlgL n=1 Tax=Cohaesibacter celericrescens TaxID=2067669 RepID=A0A2N5XPQ0_9HYPH|nr:flagellin [Cohaesibacter celericrescens]PLW76455.1 flagellar biosynthesis protein FlgL [Cohaesibacter celericrescens]